MRRSILLLVLASLVVPSPGHAQSATTEALQKQHSDALGLFFYKNTLRMLNQTEDTQFDELIKEIEKMRFLAIKKEESRFTNDDYKKLLASYRSESFEEIMTSRHEGKNFDVYLKQQDGKTKGMLVLINDTKNLYILDILGRIALDKVTQLYQRLDESTDIGSKIRSFAGGGDDDKSDDPK